MSACARFRKVVRAALLTVSPSLLGGLVCTAAAQSPADTVVSTASGLIEGASVDGVLSFKGIAYAAPPVGDLRWRDPQPAAPWLGIRKAQAVGNACIQKRGLSLEGGGDPGVLSEDCLVLNVWAPLGATATASATASASANPARLPVMLWIHGGALIFGAGGLPIYDGAAMARRGAVIVSINYRLGALGFFSHPGLGNGNASGTVNFGLLDQVAALQWVQQNIAAFGGDPRNVAVFGQSAGAQSVLALFASPAAKGLFAKGIAQSPYGIPSHSLAKAEATGIKVASALGLKGANASAAELRAVPVDAFEKLEAAELSLAPGFVTGDRVLPAPILQVFQQGGQAPLPLIIGSNSDDGSVALAFGIQPQALVQRLGAARIFVKSLYPRGISDEQLGRETVRDLVFTTFAKRIAYLHADKAPTWRYYFSHVPDELRGRQPGAPHGGEVAFVLGTGELCQCTGAASFSEADRAVSRQLGQRWFEFARAGEPVRRDGPGWPKDARRVSRVLQFSDSTEVQTNFMKTRLNTFIGTLNVADRFLPAR